LAVVCDKLVYLQLQKTACTTIGSVLIDFFDGRQVDPPHAPLSGPRDSRFFMGSVRNPWDYYVSLWAYGCAGKGGLHQWVTHRFWKPAALHLPDPRPLGRSMVKPVGAWRRLYADARDVELFRRWIARVHDPRHAHEAEGTYGTAPMRGVAGLATYRYCQLYVDNMSAVMQCRDDAALERTVAAGYLPDAMVRMESLTDELLAALRSAGYEISPEVEEGIRHRTTTRRNPSEHGHYTEYYDDQTRELVERLDRLIISRHGYSFGG
jgi:hypothetical protein